MIALNDWNIIERTIVKKINTALDNDVLSDLIDNNTGLLVGTIPDIMGKIYNTYGTVTSQSLTVAKSKLEKLPTTIPAPSPTYSMPPTTTPSWPNPMDPLKHQFS